MKIGIFPGSFNPIHIGHIILGNYIVENTDIEQVWFLVTPQNPLKKQDSLHDEHQRLEMVQLATAAYKDKLLASDFEFHLPRPSYTVDTLKALSKQFPQHEFSLIIGGDNWDSFSKWKDYDKIIDDYNILIYPRLGNRLVIPSKLKAKVEVLDSLIIEISSTDIRQCLQEGSNARPYLPIEVFEYIEKKQLYR